MRPRLLVLILLGLALPWAPFAHAEDAGAPLRLEDAVRMALSQNERARKAPLRVEAAEGQLDRARGSFFPTLTAGGSTTFNAHEDKSGRSTTYASTATLTQPLLQVSSFPLYSQASHQLEAEKWGAAQDKRQLAFDTARSFLQTLGAERVLDSATKKRDRARANLDDAQARVAAQLASVNDATRATLDLATSDRDLAVAQGDVAKAYLQLSFLVGRRVGPPLAAPDSTTRAAQLESATPDRVREALERRPDLRSSHERTEALNKSASEPLLRLIPTLNAQGQIRGLPDPLATERTFEETATLNLTWSIFDAGFRYADRRTRSAQAESQALDESLLRRSVETDIQVAIVTLRAAREALRIADGAVATAQKNTEETEILYRQGLARAIEMTDANGRRFDAEVSRTAAKLSMEQAYLDLRFALGLGPVDEVPVEKSP